jgi:hypothetical protein
MAVAVLKVFAGFRTSRCHRRASRAIFGVVAIYGLEVLLPVGLRLYHPDL